MRIGQRSAAVRNIARFMLLLGLVRSRTRKPFCVLIPLAPEIGDSLPTKIGHISLHSGLHGTPAESPKLLPVLLTVENCRLECAYIKVFGYRGKPLKRCRR